jgi:hypothetical protein
LLSYNWHKISCVLHNETTINYVIVKTNETMKLKLLKICAIITVAVLLTNCGSNRCTNRKDCNGNKKTYNKSGGFWM